MEHECCDEADFILEFSEEYRYWYITTHGAYQSKVGFCPFCGEKLPVPKQPSVQIGDYVVKTEHGEIRILPKVANGHDGILYAEVTDILMGRICELGISFEDHMVRISPIVDFPYSGLSIRRLRDLRSDRYTNH